MQIFFLAEQQALCFEQVDNDGIGIFEKQARYRRHLRFEIAIEPNAVNDGQIIALSQLEVVDPVGGCNVHDPGTIVCADKVCRMYPTDVAVGCQVVKQALVAKSNQISALDGFDDFVIGFSHGALKSCRGKDQNLITVLDVDIVDVRTHSQGEIGWQGPGSGRPDEKGGVVSLGQLKTDGD